MKIRGLLFAVVAVLALPGHADGLPVAGQDYQSLQIASSKDVDALKKLYARYTQLPFLRLEKRGALHVLRAGFWDSRRAAEAALARTPVPGAQLRTAAFRPEALLQHNWTDTQAAAPTPTPVAAATPVTPPADTPEPPFEPQHPPAAVPRSADNQAKDTLKTFNQEDFALAYDVLLGTGDLQRAYRVAQQAVAKAPQDRAWRRKLARVAEWTQHPDVAAAQWQALFQLGDHADDTLAAVLRLSSQLENPGVALQVRQIAAQRTEPTAAQWQEMLALYEELAEPAEGSRYFEAQYTRSHNITLLEYAARLAGNAGDDERALTLNLQRARLQPFSMDHVLRAAVQLVRTDRLAETLTLMQAHDKEVPPEAAEYWRLLGQVAWELGNLDSALDAYRNYTRTPQATASDWSRLVFLVRPEHPAEAADLALDAYRRFGVLDQLVLALEIYAGLGDMPAQARIYASLQGEALQRAQQEQRFLLMRAQYYQRNKQPDLSWADLRRALRLAPEDKDTLLSALWFLIDGNRTEALAALLAEHASAARDSAYWLAYAAGNQALGRHRDALYWYRKEVQRTPQDALLLLNYADALERVQQAGMAARVRRHAWLLLKQKYPTPDAVPNAPLSPELLAVARLALLNQPGDPALQQVRHMVQSLRNAPDGPRDAETRTLVLGWAVAQEQFANARSWMWLRYARQAQDAAPLWGPSQVALQLGDTATMDKLLARDSAALPIYNRYDTAYALGHVPQALDIAFQGMSQQDGDEALHDRYRQHAPGQAAYLQLLASQEDLGTLNRQGLHWEARLVPTAQLQVLVGWARMQQSSTDPTLQSLTPAADQLERVELQWQNPGHQGSLAVFQRDELASYTGLHVNQTVKWGERLGLDAGLDYRADSTISLPLQVAGYENSLYGSLNYTLGKREYLRVTPRLSQYYTQYGDYLGSGRLLDLEAGYRIRTEYPDWRIRAIFTQQDFTRDGGLGADSLARLPSDLQAAIASGSVDPKSYFIPDSSSTWGLCFGMGENLAGQSLQTVYTRAWRPYFDLCLRDNSVTGNGYTSVVGIAGSWTGEDHVSLELQNTDGLTAVEGPTRTLALRYRHYF